MVDLGLDERGDADGDVFDCLLLDLQRFHEALGLRVLMRSIFHVAFAGGKFLIGSD
jgi:hypothetical protein